jgi:Zn-dependent peptidase ImmA (M78 family)
MLTKKNNRAEFINFYSIFPSIKYLADNLLPKDNCEIFTKNPSVDIESIAKNNGITEILPAPPDEVFGKHAHLIRTIIYINNQGSPEKRRFSIAHEIFHLLMRDKNDDGLRAVARQGEAWKIENAGSLEAITEEIADYFAANLLIPTERFVLWEDKSDEDIAKAFGVETKCIRKRREEIAHELDIMTPKDLSSDVNVKEQSSLSFDELDNILGGHNINASGQS